MAYLVLAFTKQSYSLKASVSNEFRRTYLFDRILGRPWRHCIRNLLGMLATILENQMGISGSHFQRERLMFKKFNIWYDGIQEPKRFFVFLSLAAPGILMTGIADYTDHQGFASVGLLYLCMLLILRLLGKQ